ncbi:MAG: isocitrate/isopropylmalate dehydrogenase family protein [Candidatus Methylarchaceae archaeon HK02M1]|nr:isocitrate/isopropylmalate dehydrogenase family protein [Candidatus Methylarchaceae archaeon HK01M]MCP8311446.1 isocitrate/isopropylmalate dehydrogenase family protein [Candidatus Methylarchaceae archaeon HK02M1]
MGRQVALIRGDGTGPELVDAMIRVVKASKADVDLISCDAGLEWWEKNGGYSFIPPETWEILEKSVACFKGPTTTIPKPETPKSVAVSIRQKFKLFANVRPIKTFPNTSGPLGDVDFICVREATEGLYTGIEFRFDDIAIALRKISRRASDRVTRYAFYLAREKGLKKVVVITKGNILKETDGLFREVVEDIAKNFPEIVVDYYFIDNFAQQLVKNPQRFNQNVILSTNLFMDIISEEASGLVGSIGCVYSANIGENYAMFEPAHGSAPKYKGMDKVNPTATILSGAWMLDYVGEKRASKAIFKATNDVIAEGKVVTYDLGGKAKLSEMAEAIAQKTEEILR